MSVAWYNCAGGLLAKIDVIKLILSINNYDVLFVSESEIKIDSDVSLFKVKGYELVIAGTLGPLRNARSSVFIKEDILPALKVHTFDSEVICLTAKSLVIAGVYRQFKLLPGQTYQSELNKIFASLDSMNIDNNFVIIGGDFNLDWERRFQKSYQNSSLLSSLESWSDDHALSQMVTETTRHRDVNRASGSVSESSCLDLIFTNNVDRCTLQHSPGISSDHDIVGVSFETFITKTKSHRKFLLRDWRNFSSGLVGHSAQCNPVFLDIKGNIDSWSAEISNKLMKITDEVAPFRVIRSKNENDVINSRIAALTKKRDRAIVMARRNRSTALIDKAHSLSLTLKKVIKREKLRLTNAKARTSDPKGFWRLVNSFVGRSRDSSIKIREDVNGEFLPDIDASERFATFFDNKIRGLCGDFRDNSPDLLVDDVHCEITPDILDRAIAKVKPKKSVGPDGIPMIIMKETYPFFKDSFLFLFNEILKAGKIPSIWKRAIVTPIFKKGNKDSVTNYRPVSGLCSLSKLFERCILEMIDCSSIEGEFQHGFRTNHSTTTAMLAIQNIIAKGLDENRMVLVYSTDLTAAFDMLRPGLMIERINGRLPYRICRIMKDFLTNRSFSVKVGSEVSSSRRMDVGCAQGSTLGPKLFSMYCGGLGEVLDEKIVAYADDAYVLIEGEDIHEIRERANLALKRHTDWLLSIGMVVNIAKTESVLFHRSKDNIEIKLDVNGIEVKTSSSMRVLGVTFDSRLRWDVHLSNTIANAKRAIQGLRILRRNMSRRSFLHILTAQFFSKMYYGSPVWLGHLSSKDSTRIMSLHYRALRIACQDYRNGVPREILDHDLRRATPSEWNDYSISKEIIRIYKSESPRLLFKELDAQSYQIKRPVNVRFYDTSRTKVGLQALPNKSAKPMNRVDFDWYFETISNDALRIKLKQCFFKYPSSAESLSSVPGRVINRHLNNRIARRRRESSITWTLSNRMCENDVTNFPLT